MEISHLRENLNWMVLEPCAKFFNDFRAPSWSWACLDGPVIMGNVMAERRAETVEWLSIIDVRVQTSVFDCTGKVLGGYIIAEGRLFEAQCCSDSGLKIKDDERETTFHPDSLDRSPVGDAEVSCLVLCSRWTYLCESDKEHRRHCLEGLVLESIDHHNATYHRTGHFTIHNTDVISGLGFIGNVQDGSWVMDENTPLTTITII